MALSGLKPLADTSSLRKAPRRRASTGRRLAGRLDSSGVRKIGQRSANMPVVLARGDAEADGRGRCRSVRCLLDDGGAWRFGAPGTAFGCMGRSDSWLTTDLG